jgi:hypothetical protein
MQDALTDPSTESASEAPTESPSPQEQSEQLYQDGCNALKSEEFVNAIEMFGKSAELRQETSPDMYRNQAWCLFRLAEIDQFQLKWTEAGVKFRESRSFYERAYAGFAQMRKEERSEDFMKRLKLRLNDCRKRGMQIDGHIEFLERRHAWCAVNGDITVTESSLSIEAKRASDKLMKQSKEQIKRVQTAMNSLKSRFHKEVPPPPPPEDEKTAVAPVAKRA